VASITRNWGGDFNAKDAKDAKAKLRKTMLIIRGCVERSHEPMTTFAFLRFAFASFASFALISL